MCGYLVSGVLAFTLLTTGEFCYPLFHLTVIKIKCGIVMISLGISFDCLFYKVSLERQPIVKYITARAKTNDYVNCVNC